MTTTYVIKTRSKAVYALVRLPGPYVTEPYLVGYAYSLSPRVLARARRERAVLKPIKGGRVEVEV